MVSAVTRVCGQSSQWGPGAEPLVRGPAEDLVFGHLMEATKLPTFLKFGNAKKSDICVIFAKDHGWPQNWRVEQNWGACFSQARC